jgi:hypothetical protein
VRFLRRKLALQDHEAVFCYVNSVFAPGLDEGVGNLWRVSGFFFFFFVLGLGVFFFGEELLSLGWIGMNSASRRGRSSWCRIVSRKRLDEMD